MALTVRRLGVLTGLAAAGWLLGGAVATADELPGSGLAPATEVASGAGISGAEPDSEDRPEHSGPTAGGTPGSESVGDPIGVADAAAAAGTGAGHVVVATAQGAGEVVASAVGAGNASGEPAAESGLTGAVSAGINGPTGALQDQVERTAAEGPRAGLDGIAASLAPRTAKDDGKKPDSGAGDSEKRRPGNGSAAPGFAVQQAAPAHPAAAAAMWAEPADSASSAEADPAEPVEPVDGTSWHDTSDSTGTVSSSPMLVAPAAFLLDRGHTLRLVAQRVALPTDPAVVVRYTADDPSFSPD
ncbi:hypothetical protein [Streptomonospora sediminis]